MNIFEGAERRPADESEKRSGPSRAGTVACCLIGGTALGITAVCWSFVAPALRKVCLPYVPATDVQVRRAVRALGGCKRVLDLGSGDGRIVLAALADRSAPDRVAHGIELNPWLVWYSRLAARRAGLGSRTSFYRGDLWKFDLKPYDGIIIFGVRQMMDGLADKIEKEVRPGTVVVACRFPLPETVRPSETLGSGIDTVWKYEF